MENGKLLKPTPRQEILGSNIQIPNNMTKIIFDYFIINYFCIVN
jgi:hypothetical protein